MKKNKIALFSYYIDIKNTCYIEFIRGAYEMAKNI